MELIKKTTRKGVFETNSSSCHSIVICSEEKLNKFKDGEIYYNNDDKKFYTKEEVLKEFEKDKEDYEDFEDFCSEISYYKDYDTFLESLEHESFKEEYESKSGDKIVAFGYYGYDS